MLASQESILRSQPSEADYRAATVKQRPTSRRITPAEISVSAPTDSTLADSICHYSGIHTNSIWHLTHLKTPGLQSTTQHCTHICVHCLCYLFLALFLRSLVQALNALKLFHNTVNSRFCCAAVTVWETRDDSSWRSSPRHWERSHTTTKGDVQDQVFW